MSVSRETSVAEPRLSVRAGRDLKAQVHIITQELQRRGLGTSAGELVVLLVRRGLRELSSDRLHDLIVEMREEQAG